VPPMDRSAAETRSKVSDSRDLAYEEWTDAALTAAIAGHDGRTYEELYRRHSRSVLAVARMILGNLPDCEDIVAEIFVGLWLLPGQYDPERGSLLSFLRMKARNRSIDLLRSSTARRRRELGELSTRRDVAPDVESAVLAREDVARLRRAVGLLPEIERESILLAYFAGMSYRAVALHLDLPEGTVKSRIRAGLRRLSMDCGAQLGCESDEPLVEPRGGSALGARAVNCSHR